MSRSSLFVQKNHQNQAKLLSRLAFTNPFTPERIELEQACLGDAYQTATRPWNEDSVTPVKDPNIASLKEIALSILNPCRKAYLAGEGNESERENYRIVAFWVWFHQTYDEIDQWIENAHRIGQATSARPLYQSFQRFHRDWLGETNSKKEEAESAHAFAGLIQIRRAFVHIFRYFIGSSKATLLLRKALWESIFTWDMEQHRRHLFAYMSDMTTLITGPTGSGKEVVARALGLSRYIPWDVAKGDFAEDFLTTFIPVNLSALSSTLLESEVFGHKKGAFTGAFENRIGYLEACGAYGSIFLDEIGECSAEIQVKLLRVLQTREFNRIGDVTTRKFRGKCIAATNRNLPTEVQQGRFREDLFYRLHADHLETPPLQLCLQQAPEDLSLFVTFLLRRLTGQATQNQVQRVLEALKPLEEHRWPGNFRELEQAVRHIIIHRHYHPPASPQGEKNEVDAALVSIQWPLDSLIRKYVQIQHHKSPSRQETARRLEVDARTIKRYLS